MPGLSNPVYSDFTTLEVQPGLSSAVYSDFTTASAVGSVLSAAVYSDFTTALPEGGAEYTGGIADFLEAPDGALEVTSHLSVTLVAPLADSGDRITAIPDLEAGDILEWRNVVGGTLYDVTINTDGSFEAAQDVTAFEVRAFDGVDWGAWVEQTVGDPVAAFDYSGSVADVLEAALGEYAFASLEEPAYSGSITDFLESATGDIAFTVPVLFTYDGGVADFAESASGIVRWTEAPPAENFSGAPIKIYVVSDVSGMRKWVEYIPVRQVAVPTKLGHYDDGACMYVETLANVEGLSAWSDYTPVSVVVSGKAWSYDDDGYVPVNTVE